jgi:hypothetical protein
MINIIAKNKGCIVELEVLDIGQMHTINGEELTPLEVSKLALYYSLNLEKEHEYDKKNNNGCI